MKIKTITTWADYNYGASLQAYALLTYLQRQGHDVELIKFLPHYQTRMYNYMWVNPESKASRYWITRWIYRIAKFTQRLTTLKRKKIFDEFNFKTLNTTTATYRSYEELCANPPEANLYIVGSDQVWNVLYDAGRDPAFYLEFVKSGRKVSYAASFSYLNVDKTNRERIASSLSKFDGVAVREYQGRDLLQDMGIKSTWVLDPVFLLPLSEWNRLAAATNDAVYASSEKYVLVYDFERNDHLKSFAQEYARRHNLKIYAITDKYPLKYAHKNFKKAGPKEFVRMISGCEAFISNSFHGTAFSIMYHKPVFVFSRKRHKVNSRMESLLTLFELKDCIVDDNTDHNRLLNRYFDWERTENIRREQLEVSIGFLKKTGV
ncbi:MAG: polysaccharide pyruvyl transferase family protein [Paraprevotella sp.]|nr:polysaccharide pyruvyl transferase family protein [Paraprevotella sp.]